jgi:hypothetical protein
MLILTGLTFFISEIKNESNILLKEPNILTT